MIVTATGARRSARAANSPPKPEPMITTRCTGVVVIPPFYPTIALMAPRPPTTPPAGGTRSRPGAVGTGSAELVEGFSDVGDERHPVELGPRHPLGVVA